MAKHQIFWLAVSLIFLTVALWCKLTLPVSINVDGAFHLQCAQLILDGKLPYVDVYDNNPPLSIYLHMLPCVAASVTGAHVVTCFNLAIWLLAVASLLWSASILTRSSRALGQCDWGLLLLAMSLITYTVGADYGQREHIFVLCAMPLLMVRWVRWQTLATSPVEAMTVGPVQSFLSGVVAGIGLLLKPYFFLPFIGAELVWVMSRRTVKPLFAPEYAGCMLAGCLYALHFLFLPQAVQESFFHDIVPLVIHGYGAYNCKLFDLLRMYLPVFYGGIWYGDAYFIPGFALALSALAIICRKRSSLLLPLVAFTLGGYAVFVLQHKGWSNHTIPMLSGCFLLAALELAVFVDFRKLNWRFILSAFGSFVLIVVLIGAGCRNEPPLYEDPELLKDLTAYTASGDKVLVMATVLYPAYPLLTQLKLQPGSRYLHTFHFPMLEYWKARTKDESEKKRLEAEESLVLDNICTDINQNKPKLITIETRPLDRGDCNFKLSDYLQRHDFIANDLKDYQFVRNSGSYLLYKRIAD